MSILGFEEQLIEEQYRQNIFNKNLTDDYDQLELPRKMNAKSDDDEHLETVERFLQLCVERMLDKNQTTNEKLYTIASSINMITEFIIAESRYSRIHMKEIHKLLSDVEITQDLNE